MTMCLAKAYVYSSTEPDISAKSGMGVDENLVVMENVTQVEVDGDQIRLKSLLGDSETVRGCVANIDFAEGRLVLRSAT